MCNPVRTEDPGWCLTESSPSSFLGFCSDLWYHTPGPNRIPTIPTLGCISSWFHAANWKPLEEIHIGIQTPEHLAKPNPAGLCTRRWPPLEPQPISPCQCALPLLDKRSLCSLTYSTQMSKHALVHRRSLLPLNGLYFSNHVLKLNHETVWHESCAMSHIRPGLKVRKINRDKSHHRYAPKTNWRNKQLVH